MTYSHVIDVPAPIEFYDVSHAAIRVIAGPDGVDGLLVHVGRATDAGFEIVEVWQSKEHAERFVQDLWPKVMATIPGGAGMAAPQPREFELRGLNIVGSDGPLRLNLAEVPVPVTPAFDASGTMCCGVGHRPASPGEPQGVWCSLCRRYRVALDPTRADSRTVKTVPPALEPRCGRRSDDG